MDAQVDVNVELKEKVDGEEELRNIKGDSIGNTLYSERFVLKLLMKLVKVDTLSDDDQQRMYEDDLSFLWDMTVDDEVVMYLYEHDVLNLFSFTLPAIGSSRIVEIILGIIGNMCNNKLVSEALSKMEDFVTFLLEYIMKTDDSPILIQLLRMQSTCMYSPTHDEISRWLHLFQKVNYSRTLYFILNNSINKDLLVAALENFNSICSTCCTEKYKRKFFKHFVKPEAFESLIAALEETTQKQKTSFKSVDIDRIILISLQISLNLLHFKSSPEVFDVHIEKITGMINAIMTYQVERYDDFKAIYEDLDSVICAISNIVKILGISETCDPDKFFVQSYSLWKTKNELSKLDPKTYVNIEHAENMKALAATLKESLSLLICVYMEACSVQNLSKVLNQIGDDYKEIVMDANCDVKVKVIDRVSKLAD